MESCHTDSLLHSPAAQRLTEFIHKRREHFAEETHDFERFEQELHELLMSLECELIGEELSRYDLTAEELEVDGKVYQPGPALPETYLTAAGRVSVRRHLYYPTPEAGPAFVRSKCGWGSSPVTLPHGRGGKRLM